MERILRDQNLKQLVRGPVGLLDPHMGMLIKRLDSWKKGY